MASSSTTPPPPLPPPAPTFSASSATASPLLQTLLHSPVSPRTLLLLGPSGIGKSSILSTLVSSPALRATFAPLVLRVSLSSIRSDRAVLTTLLLNASASAPLSDAFAALPCRKGTAPRGEQFNNLLAGAVRGLAESEKPSLLILDDFAGAEAREQVYRIVAALASATVAAHGNFRLVISCSADELTGFHGCAVVRIGCVDGGGKAAREVLMRHAGVGGGEAAATAMSDEVVEAVVDSCAGFPLALSVAGAAVRAIGEAGGNGSGAWQEYACLLNDVTARLESQVEGDEVKGLDRVFMAGLVCLQMSWPEELPMASEGALLSLCVLRKGDAVCVHAFAKTWGLQFEQAKEAVKRLEGGRFLVTIQGGEGEGEKWKVHECVSDFGTSLAARSGGGMEPWHRKVVDGFGESLPVEEVDTNGDVLHKWWSGQPAGERYLSDNIVRHLLFSGKLDLALKLLVDYRWIQYQNSQKDQEPFQAVLSDVSLLEDCLEEEVCLEMLPKISTLTAILADLDFLTEAIKQAMPTCFNNPHECSFQLHGRLCGLQGETNIMEWCVKSIEKFSNCPWVQPVEGLLERPVLKLKRSFPQEHSLESIALYPSAKGILVSRKNGMIDILRGKKGVVRNSLSPCHPPIPGNKRNIWVGASRTSADVYSLSQSTEGVIVGIWKDGANIQEFRPFSTEQEVTCATLMQINVLACGTRQGTIYIVDCCTGTSLRALQADLDLEALAATPDAQTLISLSSTYRTLRLWDMAQEETPQRSFTCAIGSTCVAVSRNGQLLACGRLDGMIQILSATTGTELKLLTRHTASISCIAFSHDDKYVYSGSLDHTVVIWDLRTGAMRLRSGKHKEAIISMALSKGGNELYYASENSIWVFAARPALSENEDYATNFALRNEVQAYCLSTTTKTLVTVETDRICFRDGRGPNTVYEALHHKPIDSLTYNEIRITAQGSYHTADCIAISPSEELVAYSLRMLDIGIVQVYLLNRDTGSTVLLDDIGMRPNFCESDTYVGCETEKLSFLFGENYLKGFIRFDVVKSHAYNGIEHRRYEVLWNANGALVYAEEVQFHQDNTQVISSTPGDDQDNSACLYMVNRYKVLIDRPKVTLLATLPKGAKPIMSTLGTIELPATNAINFVKRTGRLWILNEDSLLQYVDLKESSSQEDDTPLPLPLPRISHVDSAVVYD